MKINQTTKKNGETVYRASVYLGIDQITGKKVKKTISAKTKRELQQKTRQAELDFYANGSTVHTQAVKVATYTELVDLWKGANYAAFKPNTINRYNMELRRFLLPAFGTVKLDKLNRPYIQKMVNTWADKYNKGKGGYKHYPALHRLNKKILAFGVALGAIDVNPCHDVIVPKRKPAPPTKKHFDNKEVKAILDYLDSLPNTYKNNYKTVLYKFLLATGCRVGEALALEWSDIDLENATVSISKTLQRDGTASSTKTQNGTRIISIDKETVLMLRLYKVRQAQKLRERGDFSTVSVFSNCLNHYASLSNSAFILRKDLKKIGISGRSFHAFRHTHASLLLNAGIPYKELSHRLGHANISITLDTYSHLSKENERQAVSYFEKSLETVKSS